MNTEEKTVPSSLEEQIRTQMHKAWVDLIKQELVNKEYDHILKLIEEIRDRLCNLTPNRADLRQSMYTSVDIPFIKQMLDHDVYGPQEFKTLIDVFLDRVLLLQASAYRTHTTELRDLAHAQLDTPAWGIHIPELFLGVNKLVDQIEEGVKEFYAQMNRTSTPSTHSTPSPSTT
jgi:hypothetical protein